MSFENLPHVTREEMENLRELLKDDVSLYEEIHTLVLCGLEEYSSGASWDRGAISERVATCILLVMKGSL
ncbi:hypothetical protein SEA_FRODOSWAGGINS_74 [Streptomyces phage FrodoSwaggins]|uniref:Uncharacterized protein n=4 Tax=Rimavirus drgrey TaxID=2560783 RepID=A0A649VWP5_9CAUD|nr:hypothetical protein FDI43_gp72 [Streptomyces phage DrGrey]ASU03984.1 hypothetical protein SEA_DRGREY_72 [Streptomyces phage DrGrey]QAY17107.1 hypothetical protein SEA_POPY_74 [Streptomyces phage Popy]QEQ94688.1 hypothetical protein SEA_SOSHI_75 [Streptomyces phage Soshi]QGJ96614.1 hypothetical protein SEA_FRODOSWAGGINS_74 [Streptomyces phage FrodoSwaggins]